MSLEVKPKLCRLLSGTRAIVDLNGLCRIQFMPSGRIHEELASTADAKEFCKSFNRYSHLVKLDSLRCERAVAVPYTEIFAANSKAMERLGRKKKRSGKK